MAITAYSTKDHLGALVLQKIAGEVVNGNALGTQVVIPYSDCTVVEAMNNTYPGVANVSAGAVNATRGKTAVMVSFTAPAHPSWFNARTLNDLIGGTAGFLDANFDTSRWDFDRYEPVIGHQRYTNGKIAGITIVYNANGGPINCVFSCPAIYAAEQGSPSTFTVPTRVTGRNYDTSDVNATSSLDLLRSFTWTCARAQAVQNIADGTFYAVAITSHSIGGTLSVEQGPTAVQGLQVATGPSTLSGTVIFQIGPAATGVKFTNFVNRDSRRRSSPGNAPGTEFWDYSLSDVLNAGGTGYPFIIAVGT